MIFFKEKSTTALLRFNALLICVKEKPEAIMYGTSTPTCICYSYGIKFLLEISAQQMFMTVYVSSIFKIQYIVTEIRPRGVATADYYLNHQPIS